MFILRVTDVVKPELLGAMFALLGPMGYDIGTTFTGLYVAMHSMINLDSWHFPNLRLMIGFIIVKKAIYTVPALLG